jgi:hypothetical protein
MDSILTWIRDCLLSVVPVLLRLLSGEPRRDIVTSWEDSRIKNEYMFQPRMIICVRNGQTLEEFPVFLRV